MSVIGAQFGSSVWSPMAGLLEKQGIEVTAIPARRYPFFLTAAHRLWQAMPADLIYALKPFPTSYGLSLLYKRARKVPVILDIDDWEMAIFQLLNRTQFWRRMLTSIADPNHYIWLRQLYSRTGEADAITVSSKFLQQQFGGTIVPHGRDTDQMNPERVDTMEIRHELATDKRIVMFLGTPRPHKGIEDLIAAVERLGRRNLVCVIIGVEKTDPYGAALNRMGRERVRLLPMQPFERLPAYLTAADVVVIPQRKSVFTQAQMPAKLYDAMAMARPIVATAVSNIPETLEGCGLVVPPENVERLAAAIAYLLDNPAEARRLGEASRKKCIQEFSWDALQRTLEPLIESLLCGPRGTCPR